MSDKPDLAVVIAGIICDGLERSAKMFHGRKVVFVDDKRSVSDAICCAVSRLAVNADPREDRGFSRCLKTSVDKVIQKMETVRAYTANEEPKT